MAIISKISLSVPNFDNPNSYFSFRLKQNLFNEPSEYKGSNRVFVISDIEGNFGSLRRLLVKNGVIDSNYQWTFEDGHLVITGDCFDRGEQVMECLWLIYSLEDRARREGGYIHFILGNHEIMNLNGDWRYIHPRYAKTTYTNTPIAALYGGNAELWRWLCTKNIIEKIGGVLFVHGGIASDLLSLNLSVQEINNLARPYYTRANEIFTDKALQTIFNSEYSPFWYRGYYLHAVTEELIDATLQHFGVQTIVTGHTVVDKVNPFFNGKVINVDTDHASGNSGALLIKKDKFYRIDKDGNRERIK